MSQNLFYKKTEIVKKVWESCLQKEMISAAQAEREIAISKGHLRKDIINAPYHIFGRHSNCRQTFCKRKQNEEDDRINLLENSAFFQAIKQILDPLVHKAHRLAFNHTTNQAQRYMSLVAKCTGGKRVNFVISENVLNKMKWNSDQIIQFLDVYERYEVLWDIRCTDHMNKIKRDTAFDKWLKELLEMEGFVNHDLVTLKTKLKTIKTVYRQEVNKILKSKKSGSGTDDLYKPKLIWFTRADSFLNNVTISRASTNNMVPHITAEMENDGDNEETRQSPTLQTPTLKRKRSMKINSNITGVENAIDALKQIVDKNDTNAHREVEDEYMCFAKHIAKQLQQLPLRSFITLQDEIQQLITRERLLHLPPLNNLQSNQQNVHILQNCQVRPQYYQSLQHLNSDLRQNVEARPLPSPSNYSQYSSDQIQQALSDIDYNDI
ncbi:hypothetical protein RN001_005604 [Aquatica leii]|uniref:MADF domain-containing protein n=1 Tax=Aquatica leii TaxID=1421715 RepID=A0AAN7SS35_9COLE|nr:hypothetical protein RN001_005604 [Aquatica leii]